jgi:hypothetical protein
VWSIQQGEEALSPLARAAQQVRLLVGRHRGDEPGRQGRQMAGDRVAMSFQLGLVEELHCHLERHRRHQLGR